MPFRFVKILFLLGLLSAGLSACGPNDSENLGAILDAHGDAVGQLPDNATLAIDAVIQKPDYDVKMRVLAARPAMVRYEWYWAEDGFHIMANNGKTIWEKGSKFAGPRLVGEGSQRLWIENAGEWLAGVRPLGEIVARGSADITLILAEQSDKPEYHHLTISYANGAIREVFLDHEAHLVRIVRQGWQNGDELVVSESYYGDYFEADGVMLPGKIVEKRVEDKAVLSTMTIKKAGIKPGRVDDAFNPPASMGIL